jgi:hypothetical protein
MQKRLLLLIAPALLMFSCGSKTTVSGTVSGFMDAVIAKQQFNQYLAPGAQARDTSNVIGTSRAATTKSST